MKEPEEIHVSVVIAAWNAEETIVRTIESVMIQEDVHVEIIVVNDGSDDQTLNRIQKISDARIKIFSQENAGAASARNHGWRHANGKYILFLDSDDTLLPGALSSHVQALDRANNPESSYSYSRYRCVDPEGNLIKDSKVPHASGNILDMLLKEEGWMLPSACMFHRSVLESTHGFDASIRYHEDHEFSLRVACKYHAVPVQVFTTNYTQSLSGKARRSISSYPKAVENQHILLSRCRLFLTEAQLSVLHQKLMESLCSQFLLYATLSDGIRLYRNEEFSLSPKSAKSLLALISIKTHINFLGFAYRIHRKVKCRNVD